MFREKWLDKLANTEKRIEAVENTRGDKEWDKLPRTAGSPVGDGTQHKLHLNTIWSETNLCPKTVSKSTFYWAKLTAKFIIIPNDFSGISSLDLHRRRAVQFCAYVIKTIHYHHCTFSDRQKNSCFLKINIWFLNCDSVSYCVVVTYDM